ncbi:putative MFS transporter [Xylariomycetidae sp. FL0641]|nr:putative MFS transporter [Xylariomycetidae sp. FL0641]
MSSSDHGDEVGPKEKQPSISGVKSSGDVEIAGVEPATLVHDVDPVAERRLLWKFDLRILPTLSIMYFFNALDKGNLGNAKTAGLEKDLGLVGDQYNIMLSVFFIPYVLFAPLVGIIGKKWGPSKMLPLMMFTFGLMTLMTTIAHDFGGLTALRMILGLAEGAFFPLVIYYQTTFYRRGELATRLAIFYAISDIASGFSGLLAFGTFQITDGPLARWKYIFIIEGVGTIVFAIFAWFYLPPNGATAHFLSEEEKQLAFYRLQVDSSSVVNQRFDLRDALGILKRPTSWVILVIEMCLGVPLQCVSLYMPTIIERLGYGTVKTNLYTVAPNVTAAVMLLILGTCSDMAKIRFPFVAAGFAFTLTGFIIYTCVDVHTQLNVAYFATFMMSWGTSAPSVILDVWYNNNIANENQRILLTSIGVPTANVMGIVASNIFRPSEAPKYQTALITTATFGACGLILTLVFGFWMMFDNKRRDKKEGRRVKARDIPTELLATGPSSPSYRWYL